MISANTTSAISYDPPLYYSPRQRLVDNVPDHIVTLAVPIIAYWSLSLFFHALDMSEWKWLEKYRIHEAEEIKKRNLVGRTEVVLAVIFQQIIQTALGYVWLEEEVHSGAASRAAVVAEGLKRWERLLEPAVEKVVGVIAGVGAGVVKSSSTSGGGVLGAIAGGKEEVLAKAAWFMYWWGIPLFQFFFAMFFIDTWQYFLHRAMHVNKFLYKSFHSWHHRLYVPYAFGSLYNHPVEGFVLDTLGAAMAEWVTGMSTRQAMVLFIVSTLKTVDDHCGYDLPWDPLQMFSGNNADYHDIHHQAIGIKSNFAQPFFVHWDTILGTKMTREELQWRKKQNAAKAQVRTFLVAPPRELNLTTAYNPGWSRNRTLPTRGLTYPRYYGGSSQWRFGQIFQDDDSPDPIVLIDSILNKESQYKSLLSLTGDRAQIALDLMQKVLDSKNTAEFIRRSTLYAMMRLCKKSGAYPTCMTLKGVECKEDHPVVFGRFGDVWRASVGGRVVSLKTVRLNQQSQVDYLIKNFTREAILWSYLDHPNLLPFYGIYHMPEHRFGSVGLVSPWMSNGNMKDYLVANSGAPRLPLVLDIITGLQHLHGQKITHGDLKPANILISEAGSALLADFGLSSVIDSEILRWTTVTTVTQTGGTIRYEAPEMLDEVEGVMLAQPTFASDVYSLASVLYEVLTGKLPFYEYPRDATVMMQVIKGKIPSKPASNAGLELTLEIWQVMEYCWTRDPSRRPPIDGVVQALREAHPSALTQEPIASFPSRIDRASSTGFGDLAPDGFKSVIRGQAAPEFSSTEIDLLVELSEYRGPGRGLVQRNRANSQAELRGHQHHGQTQEYDYELGLLNEDVDYFYDSDADLRAPPPPPKHQAPVASRPPPPPPPLQVPQPPQQQSPSTPHSRQGRKSEPNVGYRALPLLSSDLPTTRIIVSRTFTWRDEKGKELLWFFIIVDPGNGKESWGVERLYSHVLALNARVRSGVSRSIAKNIAPLPAWGDRVGEGAGIKERSLVIENYLQSLVQLPVKYNEEVISFLTTYIIRAGAKPSSPATSPLKEGYLTKQEGNKRHSWNKKFFVLCGTGVLEYYESNGTTLLGSIPIKRALVGPLQNTEEIRYHPGFFIVEAPNGRTDSKHRRHVLYAESDKERDAWVNALLPYAMDDEASSPVANKPPFCLTPSALVKVRI
ncbi:hypothetical protein NP233_g11470 [Leucocoprinus birnbaumii]|uniref:Uncharacterized protein n=1 Tax=Leucocoprinus birnbaumii TaxID=56174 RepID=A0AAD5YNY2_9AGAR|nr:hypothetical protein NP233_g11470 [Leucocoprinus birnbaumii]